MNQASNKAGLADLLAIHSRSFLMYLTYARPWINSGDQRAEEVLKQAVADQTVMIERISDALLREGGLPESSEFPIEFTDTHDLSLHYLIHEAIDHHKEDIVAIQRCIDALRLSTTGRPLADEALGLAKGHLESLEELLASKVD